MSRFKSISEVHLILRDEDKILMLRRYKTGYEDGNYSLIAGHVEAGECYRSAIIREAYEEANITIKSADIKFVHIMHRKADQERTSLFFEAIDWVGIIKNNEPDKCDDLSWFKSVPHNTVPYIDSALKHIARNEFYSEFGW